LPRSVSTSRRHAVTVSFVPLTRRGRGGRSGSLGLLASCSLLVQTRKRVCQGITGRSSAARLSRKGEHARKCVGRSEARGGLRSTCRLPSCSQEGLPGAHVLAVVPAHRGTYAEVRGRCWLQISSRNALQKQRQTRVNGGLGDSLFRDLSRGSDRRRSIATPGTGGQRPVQGGKAQGGVMSATRRNGLSREDRVACLARCGFGRPRMSGTGTSEGSSRMEVALGYGRRPSSRMGWNK